MALTAEMATAVQNATNGLLSVFGQPRNTVPFQRFFELAGRGTGEGPLASRGASRGRRLKALAICAGTRGTFLGV